MTQCTPQSFLFHGLGRREIRGDFEGGEITSDGGALLLREVDQKTGILTAFAGCFVDHRSPDRIEHTVLELVSQRVYGLALGYEDLVDHDELRRDPFFSALVGKRDLAAYPSGELHLDEFALRGVTFDDHRRWAGVGQSRCWCTCAAQPRGVSSAIRFMGCVETRAITSFR